MANSFNLPFNLTEALPIALPLSVGVPLRIAGEVFGVGPLASNKAAMPERVERDGKPYIYDKNKQDYVPFTGEKWAADAWRKQGTPSILGRKPVTWDVSRRDWVPVEQAATGSGSGGDSGSGGGGDAGTGGDTGTGGDAGTGGDTGTGEGTGSTPGDTSGDTTGGTSGGPLETGQKADFTAEKLAELLGQSFDRFGAIRQSELEAERQRYALTGALRQQGLRELSRRQIETENIKAWQALQVAREQARAAQSISLANTAYLAQIPNTGVMQAMNEAMKASLQQVTLQNPSVPTPRNYFG